MCDKHQPQLICQANQEQTPRGAPPKQAIPVVPYFISVGASYPPSVDYCDDFSGDASHVLFYHVLLHLAGHTRVFKLIIRPKCIFPAVVIKMNERVTKRLISGLP